VVLNRLIRSVEFSAFAVGERLVERQVIPKGQWYDGLHPLIDSDEERVRRGVVEVRGKLYDAIGELEVEWLAHYDADGRLFESWEWRDGEETKYAREKA